MQVLRSEACGSGSYSQPYLTFDMFEKQYVVTSNLLLRFRAEDFEAIFFKERPELRASIFA